MSCIYPCLYFKSWLSEQVINKLKGAPVRRDPRNLMQTPACHTPSFERIFHLFQLAESHWLSLFWFQWWERSPDLMVNTLPGALFCLPGSTIFLFLKEILMMSWLLNHLSLFKLTTGILMFFYNYNFCLFFFLWSHVITVHNLKNIFLLPVLYFCQHIGVCVEGGVKLELRPNVCLHHQTSYWKSCVLLNALSPL